MDAAKPLDYAPKPPAARRAMRWVYRFIFAASITFLIVWKGPDLWNRAQFAYWKMQCLRFLQPPSHVVFEMNRGNILHSEVCVPRIRFEGIDPSWVSLAEGTIFLHEMRRPNGSRCLLSLRVSVFQGSRFPPAIVGFDLGVFDLQCLQWDASLWAPLSKWDRITVGGCPGRALSHWKFFAGQPDPNNPSHLTFDIELDGVRHTCDGWLDNDGKLVVSQRP